MRRGLNVALFSLHMCSQTTWPDFGLFIKEHHLDRDCPAAVNRLMHVGLPATTEHAVARPGGSNTAALVAEATAHLITVMDALKLDMVAVDQVFPLLKDVLRSLTSLRPSGPGSAPLASPAIVREWIAKLNGLSASTQLGPEQVRQMLFDLDNAYSEFMAATRYM